MQGGTPRLAEIIVAFALALDLSTLCSIASGQFATAHEKLGKNRPTDGLKDEDFSDKFFATVLGQHGQLVSWSPLSVSRNLFVRILCLFIVLSTFFSLSIPLSVPLTPSSPPGVDRQQYSI